MTLRAAAFILLLGCTAKVDEELRQAGALESAGRMVEARAAYERVLARDGANAEASAGLVRIENLRAGKLAEEERATIAVVRGLIEAGELEAAHAEAIAKVRNSRHDMFDQLGRAWLARADERFKAGAHDETIAACGRCVEVAPLPQAYALRGAARMVKGDAAAHVDFDKAIELDASNAMARSRRAHLRALKGDVKGAMEDFDRALASDPADAWTWGQRAALRYQERNIAGAKTDFEQAVKLNPKDGMARLYLGVIQLDGGDVPGGMEHLSQAVKLVPEAAEAHFQRGRANFELGAWRMAVADCTNALDREARSDAMGLRGLARAMLGDADGAMGDCAEALRVDSALVVAWIGRGLARLRKENVDGAIEDFDEALKRVPRDAYALGFRGEARCRKGEWAAAVEDCTKAVKINAGLWDVYVTRSEAKWKLDDRDGAIEDLEDVVLRAPAEWPKRSAAERSLKLMRGQ